MSLLSTVIFSLSACLWWFVAVSGYTQFQKDCLDEHNLLRAKHGAPPLTLNAELCEYAQKWADHLAEEDDMKYRENGTYGENIYRCNLKVTAKNAVNTWYNEIKGYKYENGPSNYTGHFTQVVWKATTVLGCSVAKTSEYAYYVANYNPPGNYEGQFEENVLPLKTEIKIE